MVFGFLKSLFSSSGFRYRSIEKYLQGKVTPSNNESYVQSQLVNISSKISGPEKKGFDKYISSGAWKKVFVKKE